MGGSAIAGRPNHGCYSLRVIASRSPSASKVGEDAPDQEGQLIRKLFKQVFELICSFVDAWQAAVEQGRHITSGQSAASVEALERLAQDADVPFRQILKSLEAPVLFMQF